MYAILHVNLHVVSKQNYIMEECTMSRILIYLVSMLLCSTIAYAKSTNLEIEFTIDSDFEPYIVEYKVYKEDIETSQIDLIGTLPTSVGKTQVFNAIELQPGSSVNFYVSAVYDDGVEDRSDARIFKFTGKPVIIRVSKL